MDEDTPSVRARSSNAEQERVATREKWRLVTPSLLEAPLFIVLKGSALN